MSVQIVSFHCVLKNKLGQVISSSFNQNVATSPVENHVPPLLPKFVEALNSVKEGERKEISLSADQAYGFYEPNLVVEVPRKNLKRGKYLKVGDVTQGMSEFDNRIRHFRVIAAHRDSVTLDGNHPLAGQDLIFNVEVTSRYFETEVIENKKSSLN